ncbi:MAG: adenylosuccinate lyase, partial [Oscillospiraceae bacterium]|nr:adenylosuccinate lyase [Oscillospiraceae bacterium]
SSAMPYKRNPMRSERLCSLARYLMADAANAPMTASTQWLERTLDDSANRRISMPEGFLCADAILRLAQNITAGLRVNEAIVDRSIREYLPFLATENLMMEAVKRGGDRQALHELIRRCSMEAAQKLQNGEPSDLISRLAATGEFGMSEAEMVELLSPENYIGRCKEQVEAFLEQNRSVWEAAPGGSAELDV